MDHKLIVFDWNGTLLSDTHAAWRASNECLTFYGAKAITMQKFRETFHFPVIHFYKLNGVSVDAVLERQDEGNNVFQNAYKKYSVHARTRRGTRELLNWVKQHGFTSIILSNSQVPKIEEHAKRLKIDHYFHHISAHSCDGTSILHETSKKERLSDYMVKRSFKPDDTVIIGDSTEEPELAHTLGLMSISLTDGCMTTKRLVEAKPDHMIHHLGEVIPLLQKNWALPR